MTDVSRSRTSAAPSLRSPLRTAVSCIAFSIAFSACVLVAGGCAAHTGNPPAAAAVLEPSIALPFGVTENVNVRYYDVGGASERELLARLSAGRLEGRDGRRYQGLTEWAVRWSYDRAVLQPGGCALAGIKVILNVTTTLPRWDGPLPADAALARKWQQYVAALEHHEEGHQQIARAGAVRIFDAMRTQMSLSCALVQGAIVVATQKADASTHEESAAYDRATRHGELQGATWANDVHPPI